MSPLLVVCACPDVPEARRIADELVRLRLAACVNLVPAVESIYRWQGQIERASECLLLIKTADDRLDALTAQLVALHPYELPEILAVQAGSGLDRSIGWIIEATRETKDSV